MLPSVPQFVPSRPQGPPAPPPFAAGPVMPVNAAVAAGTQRPKIRMQAPETPAVRRSALPSPEELGIADGPRVATAPTSGTPVRPSGTASAPAAGIDWNAIRQRLERLGARGFNLARLASGDYRIAILLPQRQGSGTHHVEVEANSEAAAIFTALDQAEQWARK